MKPDFPGFLSRLNHQPYVLIGLSALMWGGNVIAGRLAVGQISPMSVTCVRWFIVCLLFSVMLRKQLLAEWPIVQPHVRRLALLGGIGFTLFNALFYVGAQYTSAVNMAVLQGTFPALVILGMALLFGTAITRVQALGVLVTFCGVAIIASKGELAALLALTFNRGDVLILIATTIFAGYTIGLRDRPKASGLVVFAVLATAAFVTSVPFLAAEIFIGASYWPSFEGVCVLIYVAIGPSLLAQVFYLRGVELIGPSRTGVFYNLVPLFGALLAVLILGEPFHLYHAIAFVLVLGGIWLAERKSLHGVAKAAAICENGKVKGER
ncbi:MAG: DMT family transporter [Hyphomicrobiales bacterium]|nr:DMT family transporter [Hyphomicrobiales bacterium]